MKWRVKNNTQKVKIPSTLGSMASNFDVDVISLDISSNMYTNFGNNSRNFSTGTYFYELLGNTIINNGVRNEVERQIEYSKSS